MGLIFALSFYISSKKINQSFLPAFLCKANGFQSKVSFPKFLISITNYLSKKGYLLLMNGTNSKLCKDYKYKRVFLSRDVSVMISNMSRS